MKGLLTYVAIFFCTCALQAQTFSWVKGGGSTHTMPSGTPKEAVYSMCTDYNGNVYTLSEIAKPVLSWPTLSPCRLAHPARTKT